MQGWPHFIPTEQKIQYLNALLKVGFDTLDFGSFVSPKAIPQMADTKELVPELIWAGPIPGYWQSLPTSAAQKKRLCMMRSVILDFRSLFPQLFKCGIRTAAWKKAWSV
jgi:hypothetical protein